METLFTISAAIGGTLLVLQFVTSLLGLGHHAGDGGDLHDFGGHEVGGHDVGGHEMPGHDSDASHEVAHDSHVSWFVGVLTFRTIVAALTFFGLAGRAAMAAEATAAASFIFALAAGGGALFGVAFIMKSLHRLRAEGTVHMHRAVGHAGTVYLTVPGHKSGVGKVHLNLQNRTVECQAITSQDPLPSGAKVVVVGLVGPDTVEVALSNSPERITHV
jgi:hypothetical protein